MLIDQDMTLRVARPEDLSLLWELIYSIPDWKMLDAPFYPLEPISIKAFEHGMFQRFLAGEDAMLIEVSGNILGAVTSYWEDKSTRWLEVGITLYSSLSWSKHIGRRALKLWINHLFNQHEVERIGLRTCSGNPRMIASAEAIGLTSEGRLRKVRYYQGEYYDSIMMGVLRDEWQGK